MKTILIKLAVLLLTLNLSGCQNENGTSKQESPVETTVISEQIQGDETMYGYDFSAFTNVKISGIDLKKLSEDELSVLYIFTLPLLTEIGARYGKSAAQVVLRWNTQRGVVVIPKSIHRSRMEQNIDIFDFTFTDEEMTAIAALDRGETLFGRNDDPNYAKMINQVKIH